MAVTLLTVLFTKMKFHIFIWIVGIIYAKSEAIAARKFVLQNEMSEHCRRRVVSSIFLGRQVADSSAQVMHFSRLDLPYSCSISVRTESGSNIILVILSKSEKSITNSCANGQDQLLVYELGETFGGYWGALPQSVFQQETRNHSVYYTLKTTKPLPEKTDIGATDYNTLPHTEATGPLSTSDDGREHNYVVMEVPLVNVSGNLELGETELTSGDENELFDLIYDVTPKNGVLYETSVMPLVQFSIWKQEGQRQGFEDAEPRYQLDYNVRGFTPDYRLTHQTRNYKKKYSNRPHYLTKRIKFKKKNKELFAVHNWTRRFHSHLEYSTELITKPTLGNRNPVDTTFKNRTDSWELIESYLKMLNVHNVTTSSKDIDHQAVLKKISQMKHNASVYLQPNLSKYSDLYSSSTVGKDNVKTKEKITLLSTLPYRFNDLHRSVSTYGSRFINNMSTANAEIVFSTDPTSSTSNNVPGELPTAATLSIAKQRGTLDGHSMPVLYSKLENEISKGVITEKSRKSESGSLVDHESWENIVQVAPVMAELLSVTNTFIPNNATYVSEKTIKNKPTNRSENKLNRKKRHIQALSIAHHGPRQLTTKDVPAPPVPNEYRLDSHRLAEVVELQDDEIQGRVALHYFKNYVGSTIFNMCDYEEAKVRQVHLFNSSRVVIAINNFTMDRITIIMTESRVARAAGCPPAHLECQVSGVRVCVHVMNACDGLPNCGAYDIYDEDRLLCGSAVGFHYKVCLAACTFLMVLLTLFYSVHYWLKRCVPKVSQAFFVYTDKSENILYLDSVMRSPNDFDGSSRLAYHSSFFDDDELSTESMKDEDRKIISIVRRCLKFLFCKKVKRSSMDDKNQQDLPSSVYIGPRRKFSFTEAELRKMCPKMTKHTAIQTGNSLEEAYLNESTRRNSCNASKEPLLSDKKIINLVESEKELTTLRRIRSISTKLQSNSKDRCDKKTVQNVKGSPVPLEQEVELRSTEYDRESKRPISGRHVLERTKYEIHPELMDQKRMATKHLRFEEGATTIQPSEADENNIEEQRRIILNTDRLANVDLDTIEEDNETASTSGRDIRRFWGKGKKKKMQLTLR